MTIIGFGILHGLDNAAVALTLAPLLGWRRGFALALMFAVAEMLMPLAGAALAWPAGAGTGVRAGVLALAGTTVAGLLLVRRDPARTIGSPAAMFGLALLLGLDNLVSGGAAASVGEAAAVGIGSAALAAAACATGVLLGRRASSRDAALASMGGLFVLALASALG